MIGTGADPAPYVGMRCQPRQSRVYHEQLGTSLEDVGDPVPVRAVRVRHHGVIAPNDDDARTFPFRIVIAVYELLRIVSNHERASGHHARKNPGSEARHVGEAEEVVRAAEAPGEPAYVGCNVAPRPLHEDDALGSELLFVLVEPSFYCVERLVPGDALPPVLSAVFTGSFHRVEDTVLVVHEIGDCTAPRAQPSLVVWIGGVALNMVDNAILTVDQHAATKVAPRS